MKREQKVFATTEGTDLFCASATTNRPKRDLDSLSEAERRAIGKARGIPDGMTADNWIRAAEGLFNLRGGEYVAPAPPANIAPALVAEMERIAQAAVREVVGNRMSGWLQTDGAAVIRELVEGVMLEQRGKPGKTR